MAKIKLGLVVTEASGKLGGHVFAKNKGGAYLRTKVTPSNPQSVAQTAVRILFAVISAGWSALTAAQRASWDAAVESFKVTNIFGDLKVLSGKALYQRLNQNRQLTGQAILQVAPAVAPINATGASGVAGSVAGTSLDITTTKDTTGMFLLVSATGSLTAGTKFVKNKLRNIGTFAGAAAGTVDIYDEYVAKFGAPAAGANVYVSVKVINASGQATPAETLKAVISA